MASHERITVGVASAGTGTGDRPVSLPADRVMTGRGLIAGQDGSGVTDTAAVVVERLLERRRGLLVVDPNGEYSTLAAGGDVLRCGADETCDVRVTADGGERVASLAVDGDRSVVLDVSGFDDHGAVVASVAEHLFAKATGRREPLLCLVAAVHEYLPETGRVGDAGRSLLKVAGHGPDRGLGLCGVSRRPGAVTSDFRGRCEWVIFHRLERSDDRRVVRRRLGDAYADAVADLDDGEAYLVTDWSDAVRRVQFHPETGHGGRGRPRPQSGGDLADLRSQLDETNARIAALEAELGDVRDLAGAVTDLLVEHVEGGGPERADSARGHENADETGVGAKDDGSDRSQEDDTQSAFAAFGAMMGDDDGEADSSGDDGLAALAGAGDDGRTRGSSDGSADRRTASDGGLTVRSMGTELAEFEGGAAAIPDDAPEAGSGGDGRPNVVADLADALADFDDLTLELLRLYRAEGPEMPADAYHAVTGRQDRVEAYRRNRRLRTAGLVEHVGRGHYDYSLRERIEAGLPPERDAEKAVVYARDLEQQFLD